MTIFVDHPVRVRVPASSANLGPGFDTAGLCLSLYDEVEVEVADRGLRLVVQGEGFRSLARLGSDHLVVSTLYRTLDLLGGRPPGLSVVCVNGIPQSRGLGSSSAAIVAGVLAARSLVVDGSARLDDDAVLALADRVEGHADNVAACLLGGFTLAWHEPAVRQEAGPAGAHEPGVRAVRRDAHPDLLPVVFVPFQRSSTKQVRGLLPAQVPHADAAANAARAALLALAVTVAPELLFAATEDRLHQAYRAPAMPGTAALVGDLRARGIAACVSGAGPTVLALTLRDQVDAALAVAGPGWAGSALPVDQVGAAALP